MNRALLDANTLIALVVAEHEHHGEAQRWFAAQDQVLVCPVVEGALVRFLVRLGQTGAVASAVLSRLYLSPKITAVDDLSYRDVDLTAVTGHRQVTDVYLVALAGHHGATLATFDKALRSAYPQATTDPGSV
ncbi:type II toxin-antitoxin system ribonuclease VapC29 [Marihabitans asiaticum]|uniref:Ribonuclease VapC n=1 Tax=Marihabitans asiaticum TaxID=415218 RepID=A0A560WEH6_9MICO|nr:TA system VapC family ribonuclease toxin [Marihabitans asiaticum]TWD16052.1 hypothetical protein FB557_1595 [Marihabitans asiaticum]